MNARIGAIVLCALALVACSNIPLAPPPKCLTPDDCAKNGCEWRTSDQGGRVYVCRDTSQEGCWRLRTWFDDDPEIDGTPVARVGPWHCPKSPLATPAESSGPPSPESSEPAPLHAAKGTAGWVVVDDDVGASAPRPGDREQARHITRADIIIGALFAVAVYLVAHAPEYPAVKCQHDGQQNCRR